MQLRSVDLRSVGPSSQKLWPKQIFAFIFPCILHCEPKKISNTISRHFSDPTQKAKLSKMVKQTRIQPVPVTGSNLQQNDSRYCQVCISDLTNDVTRRALPNGERLDPPVLCFATFLADPRDSLQETTWCRKSTLLIGGDAGIF